MKRTGALVLVSSLALVACGSTPDDAGVPELHGPDASLIAQVDCGEAGVANVNVTYGELNEDELIGRTSIGGSETFDSRYGIADGYSNVLFTITTRPTTGTCTTTLTDDETGDVVATKTSAGTARLQAMLTG